MSVFNDIQDATLWAIEGMGLLLPRGNSSQLVCVQKRKLPAAQETLDTLPLIAVTPAEKPGPREPWGTAGPSGKNKVLVKHRVQVTIISPGNMDPQSNLPEYAEWHQQICRRFGESAGVSLPEIPELMQTAVNPEVYIDREAYSMLYDYLGLELEFECVEDAI